MRPSALFLVTWVIWITAKGRFNDYWKLASSNSAVQSSGAGSSSGSGVVPPAASLPDLGNVIGNILKEIPGTGGGSGF